MNIEIGKISKSFLANLLKKLIITALSFGLLIFYFCLEVLVNYFFFFEILSFIFKKSSRFSIKPFLECDLRQYLIII